ncbi:hypothetical protein MCOR25_004057 [Pyricularia grisea]|uniref:Aminoglycoside phosphotransferase domain-containing protein n=1 Tax=Pyricularia grisea TaxID=148305 RepID=A0A6P8ASA1_PYRGI|nr:uncharacterized protein PgNI_09515 [Pyricularia grisea]KAI6370924.1 hypothetical protein MCOR25_004057 [Pyricularia grisea]TLD05006.1 hypothetical protein PgNI_09515 [Pyricularia grisea]
MASSSADFFARVSAGSQSDTTALGTSSIESSTIIEEKCNDIARRRYPTEAIRPVPFQGGCSYSLLVGDSKVLQYRLGTDFLDLSIIKQARQVYADLVPNSEYLGPVEVVVLNPANPISMNLYVHDRIGGSSLAEYRNESQDKPPNRQYADREALVRNLARFVAKGCNQKVRHPPPSLGRVGSSLQHRLEMLRDRLPERFQPFARSSLDYLRETESTIPWVLTHGDVVPGNIMIDPQGPRISGVLDWAEAEWLPMGIQLYGLEEFLGESTGGDSSTQYPPPMSVFRYFADVQTLREAFWEEIDLCWTGTLTSTLREDLSKCRVIGVLLWHGIAWDGGKLDRVVQEGIDDAEIQRLDLFLLGKEAPHEDVVHHVDKIPTEPKPMTVEGSEGSMLDDILDDEDAEITGQETTSDQKPVLGRPRVSQVSMPRGAGRERKPGFGRRLLNFVTCRGKL